MINTIFNLERLRRISWAILIALILAIVIAFQQDDYRKGMVTRGDFPGFFVQSVIYARDQMPKLYDPTLQRQIENEFWPSFEGGFYMSVYPPYDAALLAPLANFSAQNAQLIFSTFMLLCFVASIFLASRANSTLQGKIFPCSVFILLFAPIFYGIFGAQNTAFSMLLYAAVLYMLRTKTFLHHLIAGIALGVWLVKPQFAVFMFAFLIATRSIGLFVGFAVPALLFFLIGVKSLGLFWPLEWMKALQQFSSQNYITNGPQMVSLIGTAKAAMLSSGIQAEGASMYMLTILITTFLTATAAYIFIKIWQATSNNQSLNNLLLALGPSMLLLSPQTLFYDLGISMISLLFVLDFSKSKTFFLIFLTNLIIAPVVYFRELLPIPVFFVFPILLIYWITEIHRENNNAACAKF